MFIIVLFFIVFNYLFHHGTWSSLRQYDLPLLRGFWLLDISIPVTCTDFSRVLPSAQAITWEFTTSESFSECCSVLEMVDRSLIWGIKNCKTSSYLYLITFQSAASPILLLRPFKDFLNCSRIFTQRLLNVTSVTISITINKQNKIK